LLKKLKRYVEPKTKLFRKKIVVSDFSTSVA